MISTPQSSLMWSRTNPKGCTRPHITAIWRDIGGTRRSISGRVCGKCWLSFDRSSEARKNGCFRHYKQRANKEKSDISDTIKRAAESAFLKSWNLRKPEIQQVRRPKKGSGWVCLKLSRPAESKVQQNCNRNLLKFERVRFKIYPRIYGVRGCLN